MEATNRIMLKLLCSIFVCHLLIGSQFSEVASLKPDDFILDIFKKTVTLDRHVRNYKSPGYYIQPVDITTFSVTHAIWLKQFDISKIFVYDPVKEKPIDYVRVNFKIIQMLKINHEARREIFNGSTIISSNEESAVKLNILLKADFDYEIHIEMPENMQLMYRDFLEVREFRIKRLGIGRSIYVTFFQRNKSVKPPAIKDDRLKNSQGIVSRLQLKKRWL